MPSTRTDRISIDGKITIPPDVREQAGLRPNAEVAFEVLGDGVVRLIRTSAAEMAPGRGAQLVQELFGKAPQGGPSTDEIMKMTRDLDPPKNDPH